MSPSMRKLKTVIEHPATQLATGMMLLVSGLASAYEDLVSTENTFRLGAHHGVLLWGLVQMLGSIPNLIEGMSRTIEANERRQPPVAPPTLAVPEPHISVTEKVSGTNGTCAACNSWGAIGIDEEASLA